MTLNLNEYNWVSHTLINSDNQRVMNQDFMTILCKFWNPIFTEFQTKILTIDDIYETSPGEYELLYTPEEISTKGAFVSMLYTSTDAFLPSLEVTTVVDTVSGTCAVSGQCIDVQGQVLVNPIQITIENIYTPIRTMYGSIIPRKTVFYSDITGFFEIPLIKGMTVRVGVSHFGITKTVTIPEDNYADLFELIENSSNEFEPI